MNRFGLMNRIRSAPLAVAFLAVLPGLSQDSFRAATDRTSYNVGSEVSLKIELPRPAKTTNGPVNIFADIRYAGEHQLIVARVPVVTSHPSSAGSSNYIKLWTIPENARTGRYEVDLTAEGPAAFHRDRAVSFAVYRELMRISRIELDKTFYSPGDPIACKVSLQNLSSRSMTGLRVEFSDRYWPWIAYTKKINTTTLSDSLSLAPGARQELESKRAAVAEPVEEITIHQYAVVLWDHNRKQVYAIGFSPLVFIQPPGADSTRPYPGQYVNPNLKINTTAYRHFYPPALDSPAIQFDHQHTVFVPGSTASVSFKVANPTATAWHGAEIRGRLLAPDKSEAGKFSEPVDLESGRSKTLKKEFPIANGARGLYREQVELVARSGEVLAGNSLELAIDPLPKSIMIFCAHEDDEGGQSAIIRAAVENNVPIHFVYFTGGDAGSCDRYYQHSCDPAEAMNFGAIRMQETRAVLGHLGVKAADINFLGLPDGGLGKIWYEHPKPADPLLDVVLATDHAPYQGIFHQNLPFARDSVIEAVKELIRRYQPEVIYAAHPQNEGHIDHIVNGYLVIKALQELLHEKQLPRPPEVRVNPVHDRKSHLHTPYHYREQELVVSGEAAAIAQEAGWFYQSQGGNQAEGHLRVFDKLPRTEKYRTVLDWQEHEGWNERIR